MNIVSLDGRLIGELTGLTTQTTNILLTDPLGSVIAPFSNTAGSAALSGNQAYGPYGHLRYNAGGLSGMGTSKGFTGQYADAFSGLDYYHARYYQPAVGVFLSADSKEGNQQGMDPYMYVGGNPQTYNDPTGEYYASPPQGNGGPPPTCVQTKCNPINSDNSGNDGSNPPQTKPTTMKPKLGASQSNSCKGSLILGLCVMNGGRFGQGVAEVFGAVGILVAALYGVFQSAGIFWLIAQAFQFVASSVLGLMKNGINNILNSLAGPPGKGFRIFLNILQLAADVTATVINGLSMYKNITQILKYPGGNFATKWGGVVKAAGTLGAKSMGHATVLLAIGSVANTINTVIGGDDIVNDTQQLFADINSAS